jgi:hypothetical protein
MRVSEETKEDLVRFHAWILLYKKYFTMQRQSGKLLLMNRLLAFILWMRYGLRLRQRGYCFQDFRRQCAGFLERLLRVQTAEVNVSAAAGFERKQIRARW